MDFHRWSLIQTDPTCSPVCTHVFVLQHRVGSQGAEELQSTGAPSPWSRSSSRQGHMCVSLSVPLPTREEPGHLDPAPMSSTE